MGIEIFEHESAGYKKMMSYGEWRVALANYSDKWERGKTTYIERHMLTDEVFVLLEGAATLFIGEEMTAYPMERNKIYNVKQGVWHRITASHDAKVLIVENHNTSRDNSEYLEKGNE